MSNYKKDGTGKEEKFYTPSVLIDDLFEILNKNFKEEITEYLENSAGDGRIIDRFDKPYIAYDINPDREDIKQCDYLKEKIEYKKGRVTVINPPFQKGLKFLYKALKESDYVVSILSLNSLLNIDYSKYWVDDIYLYKRYPFEGTNVSIIIIGIRNRKEGDKYEYEN